MSITGKRINICRDFLTGIGILGLPLVHTIETFMLAEIMGPNTDIFCNIVISLIIFGPSIFMLFLGYNLDDNREPKFFLKRGILFLELGIILNILRTIIPAIMVIIVSHSSFDHLFAFVFLSDIYLFVGLFYILFYIFRKLKIKPSIMLLVSIIMLVLNTLIGGLFETNSETINAIIGNIVYVNDGSVFPLLSWSIFPLFGYFIKSRLETKNEIEAKNICIKSIIISGLIFALTMIILSINNYDSFRILVSPLNEYKTGIVNVILILSLNIFVIGIFYLLSNKLENTKVLKAFSWAHKMIIPFYIIH